MKKLLFFFSVSILALSAVFALNFKTPNKKLVYVDENISVYTSTIMGANDVLVIFERTGPDAGSSNVNITYTVRFNGQSTQSTFYKTMYQGETSATDHIQGPNPTGDAEVHEVSWSY